MEIRPLHQSQAPQPYYVNQAEAFWRRVSCPVLYVEGEQSTLTLPSPDVAERLALLRASRVTIDGAAHHPQLERPQELAKTILSFLKKNRIR